MLRNTVFRDFWSFSMRTQDQINNIETKNSSRKTAFSGKHVFQEESLDLNSIENT